MNLRVLLLSLCVASPAAAEHGDRPFEREGRWGGPRIVLFEHADFRGASLTLYPGDEIPNFADGRFDGGATLNDRVSSILIEGGAELFVYADARYRGHVMRVTESIRDLSARPTNDPRVSWNDRISSARAGRGGGFGRPGRPEDPDLIIRRAYQDLLGRDPDRDGLRTYRSLVIDQGWTERMVRDEIRRSAEYRSAGVDRIITRAYQDLLGRDPDPAGRNHYRRLILERDWTEQELRDALRRSDEYRNRPRSQQG